MTEQQKEQAAKALSASATNLMDDGCDCLSCVGRRTDALERLQTGLAKVGLCITEKEEK